MKNKKNFSNDALYLPLILVTIVCFGVICVFIGKNMGIIQKTTEVLTADEKILQAIVDQQSKTLAIASFSVAMVSMINTILSIFRDKKIQRDTESIEESKKVIEELQIKLNDMENTLNTITSVNAIQILETKDSECYYDLINQYLNTTEKNNYSKIALLSLKTVISKSNEKGPLEEINCYNEIIEIADEIIKNDTTSNVDKQFALLESVNALYKRARIKMHKNDGFNDLMRAHNQLVMLASLNPIDTFGHIDNLIGLVHFWTAKTVDKQEEKLHHLRIAEHYFNGALLKHPTKVEYLNHLGVTKINLYETNQNSNVFFEIIEIYNKIININPSYAKAYTNMAHIYCDVFKNVMHIKDHIPLTIFLQNNYNKDELQEAQNYLTDAEQNIDKALRLAPEFIDNNYRKGAILTYKFFMRKIINPQYNSSCNINLIKGYFSIADKIIENATKTLVYKRNFYQLINQNENANEINKILLARKDRFAESWQKEYNENIEKQSH